MLAGRGGAKGSAVSLVSDAPQSVPGCAVGCGGFDNPF